MELHYIWVKDFGCLKEENLNFSAKYIFKLLINKGAIPELHVNVNPDYIPDFFKNKDIKNITAIVGQNGTGKSTILEYIKQRLPKGKQFLIKEDIIAYTVNENKRGIICIPQNFQIKLVDSTGSFDIHEYDIFDEDYHPNDKDKNLATNEYIYYSYFLDHKAEPFGYSGIRNISTSALIIEHRYADSEQFQNTVQNEISDLEQLMSAEVAKAVQLLVAPGDIKLPFNKPASLSIRLIKDDIEKIQAKDTSSFQLDADVRMFFNQLLNLNLKEGGKEKIKNQFYLSVFANFIVTERAFNKRTILLSSVRAIDDLTISSLVRYFFSTYKDHTNSDHDQKGDDWLKTRVSATLELLDCYENLVNRGVLIFANYTLDDKEHRYIKFPLDIKYEDDFQYFMKLYLKGKGISAYLSFSWDGLSTGQQSYLSFFARIFHIKNHQDNPPKHGVTFLIDEGDAGYHPEWQRTFFKDTVAFMGQVFAGQQIQLIFTSNTPFLTSDLTNPHIIFIEKDESTNKITIHSDDNTRENTFGANIYELYSNSFYMKGVLMGEFAKDRINDIIKYLNLPGVTEKNDEYFKTIQLIGEPILKQKLQQMWIEKFSDDEEQLLLKRISEIRDQRDKNKK